MDRKKPGRAVRKSDPPRSRTRPISRKSPEGLDAKVRRLVREAVREEIGLLEDRLDFLASEASLAEGDPIPADEVWKKLGR